MDSPVYKQELTQSQQPTATQQPATQSQQPSDPVLPSSLMIETSASSLTPTLKKVGCVSPLDGQKRGKAWTTEEDEKLRTAVKNFSGKNWKMISEQIEERTDVQCLHRWQKVLRPGLVKGPWTAEEDSMVKNLVESLGVKSWSVIAKSLSGRLGKQCRERWYNHLNPDIVKDPWTPEEDAIILSVSVYMVYVSFV